MCSEYITICLCSRTRAAARVLVSVFTCVCYLLQSCLLFAPFWSYLPTVLSPAADEHTHHHLDRPMWPGRRGEVGYLVCYLFARLLPAYAACSAHHTGTYATDSSGARRQFSVCVRQHCVASGTEKAHDTPGARWKPGPLAAKDAQREFHGQAEACSIARSGKYWCTVTAGSSRSQEIIFIHTYCEFMNLSIYQNYFVDPG